MKRATSRAMQSLLCARLNLLKRRGPSDAKDIASVLGATAMAVRQHLYALEDEGLVAFADAPKDGNRGRPSKLYGAVQAGAWGVSRPLWGVTL